MTNAELLSGHLAVVDSSVAPHLEEAIYHDDVVLQFPFAPEGHTRRLEGRDAVVRYFANIPSFAEDFTVTEPRVEPLPDGFVARYEATSTFKESGRPYAQEYVAFVTVHDGRIAAIVEYYDGQRVLRALGELD